MVTKQVEDLTLSEEKTLGLISEGNYSEPGTVAGIVLNSIRKTQYIYVPTLNKIVKLRVRSGVSQESTEADLYKLQPRFVLGSRQIYGLVLTCTESGIIKSISGISEINSPGNSAELLLELMVGIEDKYFLRGPISNYRSISSKQRTMPKMEFVVQGCKCRVFTYSSGSYTAPVLREGSKVRLIAKQDTGRGREFGYRVLEFLDDRAVINAH